MRTLTLFAAILAFGLQPLAAWGRRGHETLASLALEDLPGDVSPWFDGLEDVVWKHSNDPDQWKWDKREGRRHYINVEPYGGVRKVPLGQREAREALGPLAFHAAGQLPWVVQDRVLQLGLSFQQRNPYQVALQTAILSHYVGDLHMPLHSTALYDGPQKDGLHSRWESELVERVRARPEVRPAVLEDGLLDAPWEWLRHSNSLVEPLFNDDREAAAGSNYWGSFVRRQGPVVLDQLARSAQHTAQLVLLAWHLAGRPSPPATVGDVPDESTYGGLDRR